MTSKEMEQRSGVPRANIRYYEAEGLLAPVRLKNGYRAYSEDDLRALEKIKLLRRLGVPLEELKALTAGAEDLSAVLDRRISGLESQRTGLARVEQVCGAMRAEEASFASLDAEKYLRALDAPAAGGTAHRPSLPAGDVLPVAVCPFRRFFARQFDWLLILLTVMGAMSLGGNNPGRANALAMNLGVWALLFLLEPLFISRLGTTPGKALLGLSLESVEGRRLTYGEAFWRMARMIWHGLGLGIPIFNLVQLYRSFSRCTEREPQPWDEDVIYTARPARLRQAAAFVLAAGLAFGLAEAANCLGQLPPNRGALTVAEFAENFNRQADYLGLEFFQVLDEEGRWEGTPRTGTVFLFSMGGDGGNLPFTYTVEEGRLTAVTLSGTWENREDWLDVPMEQMLTAVTAFAWAQEDAPVFGSARKDLIREVEERGLTDYTLRRAGVTVTCTAELRGYHVSDLILVPMENEDSFLSFTFTIRA